MFNLTLLKTNKQPLILILLSAILYTLFAYNVARTDYLKLICIYSALFFLFYKLIEKQKDNTHFLTAIAFTFRAVFILAIPNLSQDFYRFIWDGRIILEGINPYLHTPESFIANGKFPITQAQELYIGMQELNASHFSNYPPVNQLCFIITSLFTGKSILGSVMVLRILIIAADFGTLYFGKKLLNKLKLPEHTIFWYILNPFIIIELTGNLHFEGLMIFFLVWSLYLLHAGYWKWAAVILALSIATKLLPLLFLPILFWWFVKPNNKDITITDKHKNNKQELIKKKHQTIKGLVNLIRFYTIIVATLFILFLPFFSSQFIQNYSKTVGLWFGTFEFNASLYYIARYIGYLFRGWNEIAIIGKALPILVLMFVLYLSFFKKNNAIKQLITTMLFAFSFYLFASTTVHPWYIATLLILSVFTNYKFPLVWSYIGIISYLAYANANNTENMWIISIEYIIIYGCFIWEVFIKKEMMTINK